MKRAVEDVLNRWNANPESWPGRLVYFYIRVCIVPHQVRILLFRLPFLPYRLRIKILLGKDTKAA